ncbi:glycerophosphodiester phosphodiesterase [Flexivirga sp. B27]
MTRPRRRPARHSTAAVGAVAACCLALAGCGSDSTGTSAGSPSASGASRVTVSAHRGGDYGADNSLAAFRGALSHGVQDIEGDVHFTTDHVGVMHHDDTLTDCHSTRTITGSSWAQLKTLQCEVGSRPALLSEVLDAFRKSTNRSAVLRIEVKHHGESAADQRAAARLLVGRLVAAKMTDRAIVQDFEWRTTAATIQAASPGIRISCLASDVSSEAIAEAKTQHCHDVSSKASNWHDGLDRDIHGAGMQVAVWTVDSEADFVRAKNRHADVIITDVPRKALHW